LVDLVCIHTWACYSLVYILVLLAEQGEAGIYSQAL